MKTKSVFQIGFFQFFFQFSNTNQFPELHFSNIQSVWVLLIDSRGEMKRILGNLSKNMDIR